MAGVLQGHVDAGSGHTHGDGDLTDRDGHVAESGKGRALEVAPGVTASRECPDEVSKDFAGAGDGGLHEGSDLVGDVVDLLGVGPEADADGDVSELGVYGLAPVVSVNLRDDGHRRAGNAALERRKASG